MCDTEISGHASGKKRATIPWGKLCEDPASWIKSECVPDGFQWADPSKIRVDNIFDLLEHWRQRREHRLEPLIWESSCPLFEDVEQPSENRQDRRQRKGYQSHIMDVESEASSDSDNDTHTGSGDGDEPQLDDGANTSSKDNTDSSSTDGSDSSSDGTLSENGEPDDLHSGSHPLHVSASPHESSGMIIPSLRSI